MDKHYDLVIFGGGTVGGAIFLDAVSRGLKTALVEKYKIGRQTNRSSLGLIQRDPKYLHLDVDLVFMNAVDCGLLKTIAGDFLKKQRIIVPHFSDSPHPLWLLDSYIGALDRFAGWSGAGLHQRLSRQEVMTREPFLRKEVMGGVLYDEWLADPVELNAALVKSAQSLGGEVFEFFKPFRYASRPAGRKKQITKVLIRHVVMNEKILALESSCFINATGPWAPYFLDFFGLPVFPIRPTKGVSIIVNQRLCNDAVVVFDDRGKYITFLPQKGHKTLIGPTNCDVSRQIIREPDKLVPDKDELDELLAIASRFFSFQLLREDVAEIKCGLRPQLDHQGVKPDKITHEFTIIDHAERDGVTGLYTVFGGKLSNQIRMAKEAVDLVSELKWKIPHLRIKKEEGITFKDETDQSIEKLYAKKFALSFKDKVGRVALAKKIKSLFFMGHFVFKGLFHEIWRLSRPPKGENYVR